MVHMALLTARVLLATVLAALLSTPLTASPATAQEACAEGIVLQPAQAPVEWAPAGTTAWQGVGAEQPVGVGARIRTGPRGTARLVYTDGMVTEVGPDTTLTITRQPDQPDQVILALDISAGPPGGPINTSRPDETIRTCTVSVTVQGA